MREFARRYGEEIGLPFGCSTIPNFFDGEILDALVAAGLANVEVGVQTLNEETRLKIMGRKETNEEYGRFVNLLTERGVYVNSDHIVSPWDTRDSLKQQAALYAEIRPSYINVFQLQYFPDTRIIEYGLAEGFLSKKNADVIGEGLLDTYFVAGTSGEDTAISKDIILLMTFIPFLPRGLVMWILGGAALKVFRLIPMTAILPLRAISSLFMRADFSGRAHLKTLLFSILGYTPKVDPARIAAIRAVAKFKKDISLHQASPLRDLKPGDSGKRLQSFSAEEAIARMANLDSTLENA
jgi:hypothetical protein